ncbi:MAG: membrane protein insertion efficiency factor YidD [Negativicutes bacterium]|nr:membrane protein insertion efficiency factor YidD [Negativicutes bacterium]
MSVGQRLIVATVDFYQRYLSPLKPVCCRFQPTCSQYAREAVVVFGVRRGLAKAVCRLARCHPWGGSGYDPVETKR